MSRYARPVPDRTGAAGPAALPDLPDSGRALAWARAERANLLACLDRAAEAGEHLGHRMGEASALGNLGTIWRQTGDYPDAAEALRTALGIYREIGNHGDEAEVLNELGTMYHAWGDLDRAAAFHREALDLARALDNTFNEAVALAGLGRCALAAGRRDDAEATLRQALEIFQRIGAAEAAEVSAELAELEAAG